jgi:HSP20 family protein
MLLQEFPRTRLFETLREMQQLQQQFQRIFDNNSWRVAGEFPPINVWTSEHSATVTAEVPGLSPEDIEISVVNDTLTLKGERRPEPLAEGESLHRQERGFGQFARTIQLPYRVDADKVEASFKRGVLTITLPRTEQDRPRKISVRGEQ